MSISKETQDQIKDLYSRGYGYGAIAYKLRIGKSTARRYALDIRQIGGVEVKK
jgi:DNA-binding CsgD family transcriptional regulator|tara:strand:+ start:658 stop:816 length:159 start_codon:yes stop_codon:yes gene_type:complete